MTADCSPPFGGVLTGQRRQRVNRWLLDRAIVPLAALIRWRR
jgi:hypothetical protein